MKGKRILLAGLAAAALSSCTHKDLCYHHPHGVGVDVALDWSLEPDADPEGMVAYFYSMDGLGTRREYFRDKAGGTVNLPVGRYRVMAYNNETPGTMFDGVDDFHASRAYTRDAGLFEGALGSIAGNTQPTTLDGGQRVTIDPDQVWEADTAFFEVFDRPGQSITLQPAKVCRRYRFLVRKVDGIRYMQAVCASLSGMSGAVTMAGRVPDPEPRALTLPAAKKCDESLSGEFFTFGPCDAGVKHELQFYVWRSDGKRTYYTFDVTDQVAGAPDPWDVTIVVEGFGVEPVAGESPFDPDVKPWPEPEDVDIGC